MILLTQLILFITTHANTQKRLQLLGHHEFKNRTVSYPAYYKEQFHMTAFRYFDFRQDCPYGSFHCLKNAGLIFFGMHERRTS